MSAITTSSQPMPLAPINTTVRIGSDFSSGMESPTSPKSSFFVGSPLSEVSTESSRISGEGPSIAPSEAPLLQSKAPKAIRPQTLYQTYTNDSRSSYESTDSQGRPKFNELGRGRHSNSWLFRGVSFRRTFRKIVLKN